ncbi:MAG: hypothetical protein ACLUQK_04775 [Clostridium sp.]
MKQQLEIIQSQKQKFSSRQVPSMEILSLSQHELETLVDKNLMENPFSDVEQNEGLIETREVDFDYKKVRKKQDDSLEFELADENQDDLSAYVMPQLYPYCKTKKDEEIFTVILESLDSRGFLVEAEDDICKYLNIKKSSLHEYVNILQHVEPKGLAAKDYQECILLQLKELAHSALAQTIVKTHLEAVSHGDLKKIARLEHTDIRVPHWH